MTTKEDKNLNENENIDDIEMMLEEDIIDAEKAEIAIESDIKDLWKISDEVVSLKDALARAQADYQNLIRRVEREKEDMSNYLAWHIINKFLPFIDNLERVIVITPPEEQSTPIFEWIKSMKNWFIKTLESFWVKPFDSIWQEVDANLHDVMTQLPWEEGKIIQEFERWFMIWEKVLRHAKVVVWNWEEA